MLVTVLTLWLSVAASEEAVPGEVSTAELAQQISVPSILPRIAEDAGGYAVQSIGGLACGAACHGVVGLCGAGLCAAGWQTHMGKGNMLIPALLLLPVVAYVGFWATSVVFLPLPLMLSVGVDSLLLGGRLLATRGLNSDGRAIALLSHLALVPPLLASAVFLMSVASLMTLAGGLWLMGGSPWAPLGKDLLVALAGAWVLAVALLVFGHVLRTYIYSAVRWTQVMRGCTAADRRRGTCRDPLRLDPR